MRPPASFADFLLTIGMNESRARRRELAYLSAKVSTEMGRDFSRLVDLGVTSRENVESQVGLILCTRAFWSLVPNTLFTSFEPRFEKMARESYSNIFDNDPDDRILTSLASIFRNLRRAYQHGRRDISSLNLNLLKHKRILSEQGNRCAACGYMFTNIELENSFADFDEFIKTEKPSTEEEVCLLKYYRKPVLDHIIPHFVGGDHETNWQILCFSCNAGKGEALSWLLRAGWMPIKRISDLTELTPSLRYSVISKHHSEQSLIQPMNNEIRIFKKNENVLLTLENLEGRFLDTSSKQASYTEPVSN